MKSNIVLFGISYIMRCVKIYYMHIYDDEMVVYIL